MPAEDLAEAEAITGLRRCRRCQDLATSNSQPPLCPRHVSEGLTPPAKRASAGQIEADMDTRLAEILAEHGERLLHPPSIGDPLDALERLADELWAFKQILTEKIATLRIEDWRYRHDRVGEQIRTELYLYERALDRVAKHLVNIAKLHIREHKARVENDIITKIDRALTMALQASGLDLAGQGSAHTVLIRELQEADGRP